MSDTSASSSSSAPTSPRPQVLRLRVTCVDGPRLDAPCIRVVEVMPGMNLYDLHDVIQDAVQFDGEYPFYYFLAQDRTGARDCIPAILDADPLKETVDVDVYEDIDIAGYLPAPGDARILHYVNFGADGDWMFTVERVEERPQWLPPEYYPAVIGELSEGPDPLQYDPDLYRYNIAPDAAGDDGADGAGEAGEAAEGDAIGASGEDADDDWSLEAFLRDND